MAEQELVCPSGLTGTVRGWKAKEANLLADRRNARTGAGFDKMLSACWLETTNPGPYGADAGAQAPGLAWGKVLTCDRFKTLLGIRAATFGDSYGFDVQCADKTCREKIEWECNLSELPCKDLPDASREKIAAGDNRFEYALQWGSAEGRSVFYKLQTGDGEREAMKLIRGQDTRLAVASLASRIVEIDGVEKGKLTAFIDDLEMADISAMMDAFDESDGGIESTIEVECSACGELQLVELPLEREFWLPRAKKRAAQTMLDRL